VIDRPIAEWPGDLLLLARSKAGRSNKETDRLIVWGDGGIEQLQAQCAPLVSRGCRERRYALGAMRNAYGALANDWPRYVNEAGKLAYAQGRNNELYKQSLKLGRLAVNGWIDLALVVAALMKGAEAVRLVREDGAEQCMATIMSGLRVGMSCPYPALGDR